MQGSHICFTTRGIHHLVVAVVENPEGWSTHQFACGRSAKTGSTVNGSWAIERITSEKGCRACASKLSDINHNVNNRLC
jgi:hypothetical protein